MAESSSGHGAIPDRNGRVLDVHSHAMPLPLLEWLAAHGLADLSDVPYEVVRLDRTVSGVHRDLALPLARSQYDVAVRLAQMDDAGVSNHAVSLPPFLSCSTADDHGLVSELVRVGNDELAVYVADAPDRLCGLGAVPLGWPDAADEARRCLDELGFVGVTVGARGSGRELDHPCNDVLWSLLAERRAFILLHPIGVARPHRQDGFRLPHLVGYPGETALAVARLAVGRVLERHPLILCLAHGGCCLPRLREGLDRGWQRTADHPIPVPPIRLTERVYHDSAVCSTALLRRLTGEVGAEHVLLGTGHPFDLRDRNPVETVRALGLGRRATDAVLWDTAAGLLGLAVPRSH